MIDLRATLYRAVLAPLLVLGATALVLVLQVRALSVDARWVLHTDRVIASAKDVLREIVDQETGFRAYLLVRDQRFLEPYNMVTPERAIEELIGLTADNPPQQALASDVRARYAAWHDETRRVLAAPSELDPASSPERMLARKATVDGIRAQIAELLRVEGALREERVRRTEEATQRTYVTAAGLVVVLATVLVFVTRRQLHDVATRYESTLAETRRKNDELLANQRFRELMLGILGHDLRSPISAIRMTSQLALRRGGLPEEIERGVKRVITSATRMDRMIEQLVDMTRARVGEGISLQLIEVDLVAVCRKVVDEAVVSHPGRSVELAGDESALGRWDGDRLEQIVSNLVENALSHGSAEGVVRVSVRASDADVLLAVHNDGAPIPKEAIATLFDAFRRATTTKSAHARGLGLGLYIAEQIAKAHGGTIEVESTAERGTTFRVKLPRA